ncbi:hypothetical protein ACIO93_10595 [Streptomyces sp. NPDC087903]|uniref:hypothetical protein n=1 Tax=Streptomyces sp. NPDC087903 TaxID=3365819 RepID=UPI0037F3A077
MLIALLAVLGVNLLVLVVLLVAMIGRRRWLARQPGVFRGSARVVEGRARGLRRRWRAGYGRRVRDVFVWTPAPLLLRTALLPLDAVSAARPLAPKEVRHPHGLASAATLTTADALLEVAVRGQDESLAYAPPDADAFGARAHHRRLS